MPPQKKSAADWRDVPGAQDIWDKALPLVAVARREKDYGPLATEAFKTTLLFKNREGLPDLRRASHQAKRWMSDLLDAAGLKPVPGDSNERREQLAAERDAILQGVRAAMNPIRVRFVRSMDDDPAERARRFPDLPDSVAIFAYYRIVPRAQSEVRAETYQRRTAQQHVGAALLSADGGISQENCVEAVHGLHRLATALSPSSFEGLDPSAADQLRQELRETAVVLLDLDNKLG
ncbi:hypothetical protein ACIQBJ_29110 [Kitasatospora sp. NPDC088391]|uniref:hypothetical protein n=1 Tax=Kitasatospora sp. NPDC088391 TaxID=3364074 RepID=UPI0037FB6A39